MFSNVPPDAPGVFWITRRTQEMYKVTRGSGRGGRLEVVNVNADRKIVQATDGNCLAVHPLPPAYNGPTFSFKISGKLLKKSQYVPILLEDLMTGKSLKVGEEFTKSIDGEGKPLPGQITITVIDPKEFPDTRKVLDEMTEKDFQFSVSFNLELLQKVMIAIGSPVVTLQMGDYLSPIVFSGMGEVEDTTLVFELATDHCGVVMPMRREKKVQPPPEVLEQWKTSG